MIKVGFTGTRHGMTPEQFVTCGALLVQLNAQELHHGDCIGADHQAHVIARTIGLRVVVHPPTNTSRVAWCVGDERWTARDYMSRNHDIVLASECMIAGPHEDDEVLRSGTWSCIRWARKQKRAVYQILRAGAIRVLE
jgi:hypothetical protein